ncbi:MAG: VWA domain-containing protein [Verrucomicrobia bacterium]|nr:VWA domain-containing protein [Verrucomicrobiota bacterium]
MNFLDPSAFWFAATLPAVVVLYLLKRKRQVRLVPSTILWQRFLAENQANAPFQKLRKNLLLLLQILLLLLAIFALARPFLSQDVRGGRLQVVILDASASMQATDVAPNRFEKARQEALKWVDGLEDTSEMVIVLAGSVTELKQSKTSDKSALRRALQACHVSDGPTRLSDAFKLADTLTRDQQADAETHLFSDGAASDLADFESKGMRLVYHRVGTTNHNAGVVALDVKANPENPAQRAIFAGIANYSSNALQAELELRFNDQVLDSKPITLDPRRSEPVVFVAAQSPEVPIGKFTVSLKTTDDLAVDNSASVISKLPSPVRVLLVTRGNRFLEKALRAAGQVELTIVEDIKTPPQTDLVVLDDLTPSVWPEQNVLAIHTSNPAWFSAPPAPLEAPAIVDWKTSHTLMRFVSFDNVQIAQANAVRTPDWAVSILDSQQSPLILAGERERQRIVWVGFDVLKSSWPRRPSFIIFMVNAVEWLNPFSGSPLSIRAGEPFRLPKPEGVAKAEVTFPDGTTRSLDLEPQSRDIVVGDTSRQGVYHLKAGTQETLFAVNLLDSPESDIAPREEIKLGKYGEVSATTLKKASLELWRWIAAAALVLMCCEWWYFNKRTA